MSEHPIWPTDAVGKCAFDPYWLWASQSQFSTLGGEKPPVGKKKSSVTKIWAQVVVQTVPNWRPTDAKIIKLKRYFIRIYSDRTLPDSHAYTTQMELDDVPALMVAQGVLFVQLCLTRVPAVSPLLATEGYSEIDVPGAEWPKELSGNIIAVIDDDFAFLHENFRTNTAGLHSTRIAYLWDQDTSETSAAGGWARVVPFNYGRELTAADINAVLNDPSSLDDEIGAYTRFGMKRPLSTTHGTHVLDLAAGGGGADEASKAQIIAVRLPRKAVQDTSGASMTFNLLNALKYIFYRVGKNSNVVINFSYGTTAGPHDGRGFVERAVDSLMKTENLRLNPVLVFPAGNHFNSNCHAKVTVKADKLQQLLWEIGAEDPTDNFVEIWYQALHGSKLMVSLIAPNGARVISAVGIDQAKGYLPVAGQPPVAAVIHTSKPNNFTAGSCMALVAVRATLAGYDAPLAVVTPYGVWRLELSLESGANDLEIDAWIERDDSFDRRWPNRQSYFLSSLPPLKNDAEDDAANPVKREATSNSIAHSWYSVVVGGYVRVDDELAPYTSAGREGAGSSFTYPTVLFPSDESARLEGIAAAGSQSGVQCYMNGTSVAAPQAARWALNFLATTPHPGLPSTPYPDTWLEVVSAIEHSDKLKVAPPKQKPQTVQNSRQGVGKLP